MFSATGVNDLCMFIAGSGSDHTDHVALPYFPPNKKSVLEQTHRNHYELDSRHIISPINPPLGTKTRPLHETSTPLQTCNGLAATRVASRLSPQVPHAIKNRLTNRPMRPASNV